MALPSVVTLASATVVVAAGIGLAAAATRTSEKPVADRAHHSVTQPADRAPVSHRPAATTPPPDRHAGSGEHKHKQHRTLPKILVDVYNNTSVTGLAANKAAVLQGAGWNVADTANWSGNIPRDTVYYPDGRRQDARRLATVLHIDRLRPLVAPMQPDRLTVILSSA